MNDLSPDMEKASVLVVDDELTMRFLLREALQQGGFSVEEAANGQEALARFKSSKPMIVLLDVMMPVMDGFEACAAIRKMPAGEHVPILMVTGMDDIESINRAYEAGATDFVTKPINWIILSERVRYMLRASQAVEQLRRSEASLAEAQRIARLGSWKLDARRNEFHCSNETGRICCLPEGELVLRYEDFLSRVHPDDRDAVCKFFNSALYHGKSANFDHRILLPDGRERIVFQNVAVVSNEGGTAVEVTGTIQDITERKQAELLEAARNRVLEMVIGSHSLKDILAQLVEMVESQRNDALCSVSLLRGKQLFIGSARGFCEDFVKNMDGLEIGPRTGCCGSAAYFGQPAVAADIEKSPLWEKYQHLAVAHGLRSCLSVPILSGKGQTFGTVALYYHRPHRPADSDFRLLEMASKLAAIALEQRQLAERLAHQAHHDALTGLPNRVLIADRLEHALNRTMRYGGKIGLLYIDLDRFKHINDSLGHHIGDQLLKEVAERLESCTRKSDTLARMGGDEFMVVLADIRERGDAARTAQRILDTMEKPFILQGRELHIGASIGISISPDDGRDATTLQRNADIAMYHAKNHGGNRYRYFTEDMNAVVIERLEIENELRKAVERNEFELHYQPQYELPERKMIGVEALIRWNHPEIGRLPPERFIHIAEETGLIVPIGNWVLREACRTNADWQRQGFDPFRVAVNVSVVQFMESDFVQQVSLILEETGLEPRWLELELTESIFMKDHKRVGMQLAELRNLGVTIAIDDFGNGYSSMSYLQRLPVDCLKIDQSFIQDLENRKSDSERSKTLIKAFVNLASNLGVKLLAEGVETQEQSQVLNEMGCRLGQGFLYNFPMTADEIESICKKENRSLNLGMNEQRG